jgi:DNA-binding NarL/FixJ family response regulator
LRKSNNQADQQLPPQKREAIILLVDERAWTREAFARALEALGRDVRVFRFGNCSELGGHGYQVVASVALLNLTGVELADYDVSGAVAAVHSSLPGIPVVAIADSMDAEQILSAIERGLRGYIQTTLELRFVMEALRYVIAGGTFVPAEPVLASLERASHSGLAQSSPMVEAGELAPGPTEAAPASLLTTLTPRESAVLEGVRQGHSNKQIARELDLREPTVKVHIRHIMRKLGARNRTQVALIAERLAGAILSVQLLLKAAEVAQLIVTSKQLPYDCSRYCSLTLPLLA